MLRAIVVIAVAAVFVAEGAHGGQNLWRFGLVEIAHGFLHACAALRGRMRHGGNLVWDGILRVTGMEPEEGEASEQE